MNWNFMDTLFGPINKCLNLYFIFLVILLNFASQSDNSMVNNWGHLGGLVSGFVIIFVITKPQLADDGVFCSHKLWFIINSIILALFTIGGFILFYLLDCFQK